MIPHKLHQIWVGPRPEPTEWPAAWREVNPDWEYRLWREKDISDLGLVNARQYRWYLANEQWWGAANVARYEILHAEGGLYVDADSRPLQPLTGALFLEGDLVAAYEPNVPDLPGRVANGTIGALPGSHSMRTVIRLIGGLPNLVPSWDTTGGTVLTAALLLHRRCCDLRILPPRVFYPRDARGRLTPGLEDPYCDHFWASTAEHLASASGS